MKRGPTTGGKLMFVLLHLIALVFFFPALLVTIPMHLMYSK